jgi:preprotein translocase subunit YajC
MLVDPFSLMMMAVLALLVFFMFRNSRKQRQTQLELQEKLVPGARVMTSFGLYATLVSIDDDTNVAVIKTGKSTTLEVHRQVLTKVIEDEVPADDASTEETSKKS